MKTPKHKSLAKTTWCHAPRNIILAIAWLFCCKVGVAEITWLSHANDYRNNEILIASDLHNLGTKQQNLAQLDELITQLELIQFPLHLIVESIFFDGYDQSIALEDLYRKLSTMFNYYDEWSLCVSPQDERSTTHIAWELPHRLLAMQNRNVTFEFSDPRARSEPVEVIAEHIDRYLDSALQNSPLNGMRQSLVEIINANQTDAKNALFDKMLVANIARLVFGNTSGSPKKIMIVCGANHARILSQKILPELRFNATSHEAMSLKEIRQYEKCSQLSDNHARRCQYIFNDLSNRFKIRRPTSQVGSLTDFWINNSF